MMKYIFTVLIAVLSTSAGFAQNHSDSAVQNRDKLFFNYPFAPSEGYVSKVEKPFRREICLNGKWDFQAVPLPADYRQGQGKAPVMPQPAPDAWDKTKIKIPSPWNINSFANRNLEGPDHRNYPSYPEEWDKVKMAWMRKTVVIPSDWNGSKISLRFEAVAGYAEIYVNGNKAGENFDLFLPFEIDITEHVDAGSTVEILAGVRSQSLFEDNSTKGRRIVPAGSMWGYHVNGIWQDVYLLAVPKINISNVYIKPLVSENILELDVAVENTTSDEAKITLTGNIYEWINMAGSDILSAPEPDWKLSESASVSLPPEKLNLKPGITQTTIRIPVGDGDMEYWTPEHPNLYGLVLNLGTIDVKYERFGWREWTIDGNRHLLNGREIQLKGDSWHFMGVPQLTRRYAWAWFTALKDANANAVRPHAQVYPRFYLDVADETGICVLAETANWASDGGPKMDSPLFWENSLDHLKRMILRDRNHPAVFGWSISNENKPVILHVFNKPEWMEQQKQAWIDWRDIVRRHDPSRPWISADGEDDGEGILPVTVGHYGDRNSMKRWIETGKPWGIGEHSMAYYGTPEQVAKYNGERAYESQLGRMEGLACECYDLVAQQRNSGASYVSVFNIAWYSLQPLPFGKKNIKTPPSLDDGIHFEGYREGVPGIQPERIGPYCSTFNPGYDPTLPLYRTWPMFDAIKAANAPGAPARSEWAEPVKAKSAKAEPSPQAKNYDAVLFAGEANSPVKRLFENHGIVFAAKPSKNLSRTLLIADGGNNDLTRIAEYTGKGADIWIWAPVPANIDAWNQILPEKLILADRPASSFIPVQKSWLKNTANSDFYFCEIQDREASQYGMSGDFVTEGEILLNACNTNWRKWNKRPEELKTAAVLRSENEEKGASAVFVKYRSKGSTFYISTLNNFASSEKGYNTLDRIIAAAGIPVEGKKISETLIDGKGSINVANLFETRRDNRKVYRFRIWSPRPLDDLLIEPDMPKLDVIFTSSGNETVSLSINGAKQTSFETLPLKQGWNRLEIEIPSRNTLSDIRFVCKNNPAFVSQLKTSSISEQ
jgi:beta-galactosidase